MSPKAGNWKIKLSSLVSVRWEGYIPKLVVHEKYERIVRWAIWILGLIGVGSSLLSINKWYLSLGLAVLIFAITTFVQKSIIQFSTILVKPPPRFDTSRSEWKSMGFAFPKRNSDPPMLGPVFKSKEHAIEFFDLMVEWNFGEYVDSENNICISLIVESYKDYSVYIYPNPDSKAVDEFFSATEKAQAFEKQGKKQQELVALTIFSRVFPYGPESNMKKFVRYYEWGKPFLFTVFYFDEDDNLTFVDEIKPIFKTHLKYRKREYLPEGSVETGHLSPELEENG